MTQPELCYAAVYLDMREREDIEKNPNPATWGISSSRAEQVREAVDNGSVNFSDLPAHLQPDAKYRS